MKVSSGLGQSITFALLLSFCSFSVILMMLFIGS